MPAAERTAAEVERTTAYLAQPGLRRALDGARAQVERLDRAGGSVALPDLSVEEASALSGLLGSLRRRRLPRSGHRFDLRVGDLDRALRESGFETTLLEALSLLGGPLESRPERQVREHAAMRAMWHAALAHPACEHDARVRAWVESLPRSGALARACGKARGRSFDERIQIQGDLLGDALRVLVALDLRSPRDAGHAVGLSSLADRLFDDPHALDAARPLHRLLTAALAFMAREPRPAGAIDRRELWRRAGVNFDALSTSVLTAGLRPVPDSRYARSCLERSVAGTPDLLTLDGLQRHRLRFHGHALVHVSENPAVVEAATSRLGPGAQPIVCTGGWPNSAVCALLGTLAAAGVELRHHGDFDWGGVRIAAWVRARFHASRWRFGPDSYEQAVAASSNAMKPLTGRVPARSLDPELVPAMERHGRAIHEEAVVPMLLEDLGA